MENNDKIIVQIPTQFGLTNSYATSPTPAHNGIVGQTVVETITDATQSSQSIFVYQN